MATYAETLAQFARDLRLEDVPTAVVDDVKLRLIDTLGVCLLTSRMEYAEIAAQVARELTGAGACTVVGRGNGWNAAGAAFVNGALAHGVDFDDVHGPSIMHASSLVIPACLAGAEQYRVSGKELIVAMTVCYEALIRMGLAAPQQFHARGIQATGMCGAFAAALAVGRMAGLEAAQLAEAVGQCGTFLTGLRACADDGTWSKRLFPGWGALGGIAAVALAKRGFSAPRAVLEDRWGLYNAFIGVDKCDLSQLSNGLGRVWETPRISYKPYPTSGRLQSMIECALILRRTYGIKPEDIEEIEIMAGDETMRRWFQPMKFTPPTDYAARFSGPYVVAAALAEGKVGMSEFTEGKIHDPRILALTRRTRCTPVEEVYPLHRPGWIRVRMRDGKVHEHAEPHEPGSPDNPLSRDQVEEKFFANAGSVLPRKRAEEIREVALRLESLQHVRELTVLVARSRAARDGEPAPHHRHRSRR